MSTLVIRKKSLKTWLHTDSILGNFIISKFYFNADNASFQIVEQGQSKRVIYNISDITLYNEIGGGSAETFSTITQLSLRLEELNYPAFQYDGQITSIANLKDAILVADGLDDFGNFIAELEASNVKTRQTYQGFEVINEYGLTRLLDSRIIREDTLGNSTLLEFTDPTGAGAILIPDVVNSTETIADRKSVV